MTVKKEHVEVKETCLFRIRETEEHFGFGVLEICYMSISAGTHRMAIFTLSLHGLRDLDGFLFLSTHVLKLKRMTLSSGYPGQQGIRAQPKFDWNWI